MLLSSLPKLTVIRNTAEGLDVRFLTVVCSLLVIGLLAIYSATITQSSSSLNNPYILRQGIAATLGIVLSLLVWRYVQLRTLRDHSLLLALLAVLSLALVHLPGIGGVEINGATRWLNFGFIKLQPVEFAKPILAIYVCAYCASHRDNLGDLKTLVPMLTVIGLAGVTLLTQPDFGSLVLIVIICGTVLFLAGARILHFMVMAVIGVGTLILLVIVSPYRVKRLMAFADPFAHAQDIGYHQTHSLMAFGRGGWTGRGLGLSVEKWSYLPEAHTDFIIAVIGEELGFIGVVFVLGLFAYLVVAGFEIANAAEKRGDFFAGLLSRSLVVLLVLQIFINVGGNLSLLPVKGLTLPLLSFGGSSILAWLLTLTILLVIKRENSLAGERR